jgi:DNA-binding MarR family transcriptional regulator
MNLVIRDLERRGLIRRRPDPRGGRVLRVGLTRTGAATLRRCDRALDGIEQVMLAALDEESRKTLADHLAACAHAVHPGPQPAQSPQPQPERASGRESEPG